MKRIKMWRAAAALPLMLLACGPDEPDETAYEQLETVADTSEGYATDAAAPVVATQGEGTVGAPLTVTGQFEGAVNDAPPGSLTLTESGAGTQVAVKLNGYAAGAQVRLAFFTSPCDQPGDTMRVYVEPIEVDPSGLATVVRQLDVPTRPLLDGQHSARLLEGGAGRGGVVLACANLPAAPPR